MESNMSNQVTIQDIINATGATFSGSDTSMVITSINTLTDANKSELTFLANVSYRDQLATTKAAVVILRPEHVAESPIATLAVDNPYLAYAKVCKLFSKQSTPKLNEHNTIYAKVFKLFSRQSGTKQGIHSTAVIGSHCKIPSSVMIAANVVIGDNVTLGEGVVIHPNCVIANDCVIGINTELKANVTFYEGIIVGDECLFHSGCVVGSDGFGNANDNGVWHKIPHLGTVVIGNDVEVGANTTIDRGALKNTVIEDNVRIDNLVQIAHNVHIGAHTALAACVGVAGSATIGKYCMIGGGACINGHISVCDKAVVIGMGMVTNSITEPGVYGSGTGLLPRRVWQRSVARFRQLDTLAKRIKQLEDKLS